MTISAEHFYKVIVNNRNFNLWILERYQKKMFKVGIYDGVMERDSAMTAFVAVSIDDKEYMLEYSYLTDQWRWKSEKISDIDLTKLRLAL